MNRQLPHLPCFLSSTSPVPCPYLPGRMERRVVTELMGRNASALHDLLSQSGFRRSHDIAYAPACVDCSACLAVRGVVDRFVPSRSQKRVLKINKYVRADVIEAKATAEQYEIFAFYQKSRHGDGDMVKMDFFDYQALIEESPVETFLVEFRDPDGRLIGVCLVDGLSDGYSAVYSFFDPELNRRSLGTFIVLWLIEFTRIKSLPHAYLGFLITDCSKMSYKSKFQPLEVYTDQGWRPFEEEDVKTPKMSD